MKLEENKMHDHLEIQLEIKPDIKKEVMEKGTKLDIQVQRRKAMLQAKLKGDLPKGMIA